MTPVRQLGELITNGRFVCCLCLSWITLNSTLRITATRLCAMQVSWWHTVMQLRMAHLRTTACDTQISLWRTVVQQRMAPQDAYSRVWHTVVGATPWCISAWKPYSPITQVYTCTPRSAAPHNIRRKPAGLMAVLVLSWLVELVELVLTCTLRWHCTFGVHYQCTL